MAISVDDMISDILRREGAFVNDPRDAGGATNRGITIGALSRYLGRAATIDEVRNLSESVAREIYETTYLKAPRIDTLPDRIIPHTFDYAVNSGPRRAIKALQRTCLEAGFDPNGIDGVVGPGTRRAAVAADEAMGDWLLAALVEERRAFYHLIVERRPANAAFIDGWMSRLAEFDVPEERLMTA